MSPDDTSKRFCLCHPCRSDWQFTGALRNCVHWDARHVRRALTADDVETVTSPYMIWMSFFFFSGWTERCSQRRPQCGADEVTGPHVLTGPWGVDHGTWLLAPAQMSKWWSSCWKTNVHNHQKVCSHSCWLVCNCITSTSVSRTNLHFLLLQHGGLIPK